jgi:uncharacterized protein
MIAVDTNLLVCAHRRVSVHEFYSVVTSLGVFRPPSTPRQASAQLDAWLASPSLVLLQKAAQHWATLRRLLVDTQASASIVHDARVAAICVDHDVTELWSADRDFNRFPRLPVRNPLVA